MRVTRNAARCGSFHRCIRMITGTPRTGVVKGLQGAGIGCLECKQPVIDAILKESSSRRERAEAYLANPAGAVDRRDGTERARHRGPADDEGRARRDGARLD